MHLMNIHVLMSNSKRALAFFLIFTVLLDLRNHWNLSRRTDSTAVSNCKSQKLTFKKKMCKILDSAYEYNLLVHFDIPCFISCLDYPSCWLF